jgi:CRP/FNR family cyclic AMP-dependent transcriptional regulator
MAISDRARGLLAEDRLVQALPDDARRALMERLMPQRVRAGEWIYRLGDPAGGIYFICEGGIRIEVATGAQDTFIAHYVPAGQWFGEPSALTGQPRMVGVIAAQNSDLLHISLPSLNQVIAQYPELLRHLASITQMYLRTAIGAIADLMIRDTDMRFIAVLLRLAGIRDNEQAAGRYEVFFSQEEIAAMANVARTTANTILGKLQRDGLLEITYRRIIILDGAALRQMLAQDQ